MTTRSLPALRLDENNLGPAMLALSPQQRLFVHGKVFGGMSNKDAAVAAGYSDVGDSAKATGSRLVHTPAVQEALTECSKQLLRAEGGECIRKLVHLRDYADDEKVQLRATTELMDRMGGLSSSSQHTLDVVHHHMTDAQKDQRILALAAELGLDPETQRKLLIDPSKVIDAEFEEVREPLSDDPSNIAERETRARRKDMTPEERESDKARMRAERAAKAKAKYDAAQYAAVVAEADPDLADLL